MENYIISTKNYINIYYLVFESMGIILIIISFKGLT